jgi:hypothetical protein
MMSAEALAIEIESFARQSFPNSFIDALMITFTEAPLRRAHAA